MKEVNHCAVDHRQQCWKGLDRVASWQSWYRHVSKIVFFFVGLFTRGNEFIRWLCPVWPSSRRVAVGIGRVVIRQRFVFRIFGLIGFQEFLMYT